MANIVVQRPLFRQQLLADIDDALLLTDSDEQKKKMLELQLEYKSRNWITPKRNPPEALPISQHFSNPLIWAAWPG